MIYCLGCSYCLEGLTERRCPECGRAFDPYDESSFALQPGSQRSSILGKALLILACIGVVSFLSSLGGGAVGLFVVGLCVQVFVVLVGLVSGVFSSRPSWARVAAIVIAILQVGASILLILIGMALFSGFGFL